MNQRAIKNPAGGTGWMLSLLWAVCSLFYLGADGASAQTNSAPRYEIRAEHDPDGIGKFFLGREIARIMGHEGAAWLERPERDREERSEAIVNLLELGAGQAVADVGAGTGYFTRRLARAVGPSGRVFAVDVQPEMLVLLTNRLGREGISNVTPILGTDTDPKLPANSLDLVLMVDVYHEFEFPWEMMRAICESLKPGGRVVFVEFRAEDPQVPIKPLHKMSEAQIKKEMDEHPLIWVKTIGALPRQHVVVFRKTSG
jgi:SAM-dependent methyltransferase